MPKLYIYMIYVCQNSVRVGITGSKANMFSMRRYRISKGKPWSKNKLVKSAQSPMLCGQNPSRANFCPSKSCVLTQLAKTKMFCHNNPDVWCLNTLW